jgi:predicted HTH domain antitoxin
MLNMPQSAILPTFDYSMYLASKLYEDGILSTGQAATVANLSKRGFVEIMGKYGVSLFSSELSDLKNDIANA